MRFWCVPSATESQSPKLPPRVDRDSEVRSPPPPPRLSREEKLAKGVIPPVKSSPKKKRKKVRKKRLPQGVSEPETSELEVGLKKADRPRVKKDKTVKSSGPKSRISTSSTTGVLDLRPPLPVPDYNSLRSQRSIQTGATSKKSRRNRSKDSGKVATLKAGRKSTSLGDLHAHEKKSENTNSEAVGNELNNNNKVSNGASYEKDCEPESPTAVATAQILHPGKSRSREKKSKLNRRRGKNY